MCLFGKVVCSFGNTPLREVLNLQRFFVFIKHQSNFYSQCESCHVPNSTHSRNPLTIAGREKKKKKLGKIRERRTIILTSQKPQGRRARLVLASRAARLALSSSHRKAKILRSWPVYRFLTRF